MEQPSLPDEVPVAPIVEDVVERSVQSPLIRYGIPSVILILALVLRLWGITWGLPNQQRALSYHPDEGVNLVSGVLEEGQPRPHLDLKFYHYGGLYFYAWQSAVAVNRSYGAVKLPLTGQPNVNVPDSPAAMILVGRLLTVLCGVLTVGLLIPLGTRLFNRSVGLTSALIYAVIPSAVVHGHYATVDVPAAMMVTLALLFGAKLMAKPTVRAMLISGLTCGLACATKYNVILVIFAPLSVLLLNRDVTMPIRLRNALLLGFASVIGFILGCLGAVINFEGFRKDFLFELTKSGQGMGMLFADTGNGWLYTITHSFRYGLGIPMLLLFCFAIAWAVWKRTPQDRYFLAYFVPYFLVIGASQVRFLRYIIPVLPVVSILVARLVIQTWDLFGLRQTNRFTYVLAIGITLLNSLSMDSTMVNPDPRDLALDYVLIQSAGKSIGFVTTPWYYTPPFSPLFTAPSPGTRRQAALERQSNRMILPEGEWDQVVLDQHPDLFVVSDIESEDAIRIGLPATVPFIKSWTTDYKAVVFESTPRIFGLDFGKPAYLPNDWLYTYPTITVYVRK